MAFPKGFLWAVQLPQTGVRAAILKMAKKLPFRICCREETGIHRVPSCRRSMKLLFIRVTKQPISIIITRRISLCLPVWAGRFILIAIRYFFL